MIYFPCQDCERSGGHCPKHPIETCEDCGLTFTDDSDWSGPAHGPRECIAHLRTQLANTKLLLAEVRGYINNDSEDLVALHARIRAALERP
ncbi:MAG TPA: hypothetical protein VFA98_11625 [Thermoanaerobaculia bacterium]|jgi:hypothetical protein|nr:hypothetical protein [Thermoanaerobaculia bacterium]